MSVRDKRAAREAARRDEQWVTWPTGGLHRAPAQVPEGLVGMLVDDAARLANEAGWVVQTLSPDSFVTMDLWPAQLNLNIDATRRVVKYYVG